LADIFISYASDDRARVKPLAEALARKGWSVWWDRTIPAGKAFAEVIDQELSSARAVIVVWTSISIERNWVLEEAEDGRERGILVPVLMDDVKLPRGFRRIHAGDLIQWDGQESSPGFEKLIADLTAILGSPTGQGPETKETKPYAPKRATPADAADASDLLFSGGREGYVFALDARSGELLWKASVGGQVNAGPMSYAIGGKQYVAIAAGSALFSFALPQQGQ